MESQRVHERLKDSALTVRLMSSRALLLYGLVVTLVIHRLREGKLAGYARRTIVRVTIVVFGLSLRRYHTKLGAVSFRCLLYAITEQFFIATRSYLITKHFLEGTLVPFLRNCPGARLCFRRLQGFVLKNLMCVFLQELKYIQGVRDARRIACWLYSNIVLKKPGERRHLVMKSRFALVLIGPKHRNTLHLFGTLGYLRRAIMEENVKRVYVLAAGNLNNNIARLLDHLMIRHLESKRLFEGKGIFTGKKGFCKGLVIAHRIP